MQIWACENRASNAKRNSATESSPPGRNVVTDYKVRKNQFDCSECLNLKTNYFSKNTLRGSPHCFSRFLLGKGSDGCVGLDVAPPKCKNFNVAVLRLAAIFKPPCALLPLAEYRLCSEFGGHNCELSKKLRALASKAGSWGWARAVCDVQREVILETSKAFDNLASD